MNTERDELEDAIARAAYNYNPDLGRDGYVPFEQADTSYEKSEAKVVADALIAAGYRKSRIISTIEELNALPEHSIIRDPDGSTGELHDGESWDVPRVIFWCGNECEDVPDARLNLPATVLYVPNEEKK